MMIKKTEDHIGYSDSGIAEAMQEALEKAKESSRIEIVETRGSHARGSNRKYQVTVTTSDE